MSNETTVAVATTLAWARVWLHGLETGACSLVSCSMRLRAAMAFVSDHHPPLAFFATRRFILLRPTYLGRRADTV